MASLSDDALLELARGTPTPLPDNSDTRKLQSAIALADVNNAAEHKTRLAVQGLANQLGINKAFIDKNIGTNVLDRNVALETLRRSAETKANLENALLGRKAGKSVRGVRPGESLPAYGKRAAITGEIGAGLTTGQLNAAARREGATRSVTTKDQLPGSPGSEAASVPVTTTDEFSLAPALTPPTFVLPTPTPQAPTNRQLPVQVPKQAPEGKARQTAGEPTRTEDRSKTMTGVMTRNGIEYDGTWTWIPERKKWRLIGDLSE